MDSPLTPEATLVAVIDHQSSHEAGVRYFDPATLKALISSVSSSLKIRLSPAFLAEAGERYVSRTRQTA